MAGVAILSMRSAGLGIGLRLGHFQPRQTPEATHRLLVNRPALAIQEGPDPPVAVPRVCPGQFLDSSGQCRLEIATNGLVTEAGPGQVQRPTHTALGYVELFTYFSDDEAASGGSHGFFFKAS